MMYKVDDEQNLKFTLTQDDIFALSKKNVYIYKLIFNINVYLI